MKKTFSFSIYVMAALAVMLALGSCNKEAQITHFNTPPQPSHVFNMAQIPDMNAYLRDFKQKMHESQFSKDAEVLSLEEAAWHLSSLANYDFANANVEFTDLRYDTLHFYVNLTEGMVSMTELDITYAQISNAIDEFYQNLDLPNKHFRFIGANISNEGEVSMRLITTYNGPYHIWIPHDTVYCDQYFDENTDYPCFGFGMTELERVLNIIESRPYVVGNGNGVGRIYFVFSKIEQPYFAYYIDPYGSFCPLNSRIFSTTGYFDECLELDEMCYLLSSYHELGHELITPSLIGNEEVVAWDINMEIVDYKDPIYQQTGYHELTIIYGRAVIGSGGSNN